MNPILQATLDHIDAGKQIVAIRPKKLPSNNVVTFEFADGTVAEFQTGCDRSTFMDWWKHTTRYIRMMKLIDRLEDSQEA
jgi:hypothetical protein